jgi:hypothetical protein
VECTKEQSTGDETTTEGGGDKKEGGYDPSSGRWTGDRPSKPKSLSGEDEWVRRSSLHLTRRSVYTSAIR